MRTLTLLTAGFLLLGVLLGLARLLGGRARGRAASFFIPLWAIVCAANAAMGIRAGYPVALELAVFALTLGPPVGLAWRIRRQASRT